MPEVHREQDFYDIRGQYFTFHFIPMALTQKAGPRTYFFHLLNTFLKTNAHRDVHIHTKPHNITHTSMLDDFTFRCV